MPTLQDIKKEHRLTNKDIGTAMGVSASTAGMMLQGRHIKVMNDIDIARLASALGVTFERCWLAMEQSYNAWAGQSLGTKHQRSAEVAHQIDAAVFPEPRNSDVDSVFIVAGLVACLTGRRQDPSVQKNIDKIYQISQVLQQPYNIVRQECQEICARSMLPASHILNYISMHVSDSRTLASIREDFESPTGDIHRREDIQRETNKIETLYKANLYTQEQFQQAFLNLANRIKPLQVESEKYQ